VLAKCGENQLSLGIEKPKCGLAPPEGETPPSKIIQIPQLQWIR